VVLLPLHVQRQQVQPPQQMAQPQLLQAAPAQLLLQAELVLVHLLQEVQVQRQEEDIPEEVEEEAHP
jgi:hypothetical protein